MNDPVGQVFCYQPGNTGIGAHELEKRFAANFPDDGAFEGFFRRVVRSACIRTDFVERLSGSCESNHLLPAALRHLVCLNSPLHDEVHALRGYTSLNTVSPG